MVNDPNNPGTGTPPPPPQGGDIPGYDQPDDGGGLETGAPAVAAAPGKFFLILFLGVAFLFFVVYFVIFAGEDDKRIVQDTKPQRVAKADFEAPPAPPPPAPTPPQRPIVPDVPDAPPLPQVPVVSEREPTNEQYLERLRSEMMVFNSTDSLLAGFEDQQAAEDDFAAHDPNLAFARKAMRASSSQKAKAGHIGDMYSTIAQGKLIHGVLETAVNTQLPGVIRAITSRDIYAEAGRARLVPKGSRLIGVYNTDIFRGQERVFIVWTRIIRPDGVDIMVGSPGVDKLGRAGLEGFVDGRFRELFSTAILTSIISIGVATAAESLVDDGQVTTTRDIDGSTSSSGSASAQATAQSVANIGGVARRVIDNIIDTRPVITIDQGTKINVMVNRDLIFPTTVLQQTTFIE